MGETDPETEQPSAERGDDGEGIRQAGAIDGRNPGGIFPAFHEPARKFRVTQIVTFRYNPQSF